MTFVDIIIVGSQKSGTSSLLGYLGAHPGIQAQRRREMTWFTDAAEPFPADFYFSQPDHVDRLLLGKLAGLMYSADGVARLAEHNPAVTAVAVLREPVSRAHASYWLARRRGRESASEFEQAVDAGLRGVEAGKACDYLDWSCYAPYVERLQETLPRGAVHVVILEELIGDPRMVVTPILAALGLDAACLADEMPRENRGGAARSDVLARGRRRGGRMEAAKRLLSPDAREALRRTYRRLNERSFSPPPIDPAVESRLRRFYEDPNRRLEALLGRSIDVWRA